MKKKILISDIAKDLGISITTVSFILNGKNKEKRISDKLTQKVMDHVAKVGYKPNQLAQSLRTGKTKTIGLMVEDISNPFFANVARLIEEKAYKLGYKIIYCSTENNTEKTRELIRMFKDKHVDGYIIAPPEGVEQDIKSLLRNRLPVVLFDRYLPDIQTNYVVVNNFKGTYDAIEHLILQGEDNIGFVTLESTQTQMKERMNGYYAAIKAHGKKDHVFKVSFLDDPDEMTRQIATFLKKNRKLDAIFFSTNYLANRGLQAIHQLGYEIPTDLRIIAYDDHDFYRFYNPSITAVAQPIEEISMQVINILLNHLNAENVPKESLVLPTRLIIRDSSKPLMVVESEKIL